jgi:hypothetical protein
MPSLKVFDGLTTQQEGMNAGTLASLIGENQFHMGVNITCRNGVVGTRPPFIEVVLESGIPGAIQNITTGKFQGMYTYQYEDTTYIAFGVNGYVYLIDPIAGAIYDMSSGPGLFNQYVDRLHFCQVEKYLVVQDGISVPLIIEDTASRAAVQTPPDLEVPTGTIMAYCHGRLFVKTGVREFIAGDINQPATPTAVLKFSETEYLAGGGAFFTPADMGDITAMSWAQAFGEATGEGPLMVMCQRGICSYKVSVPRLNWQDMPIMRIEPGGNGCASEYCVVRMNEDLLFRSWHGIQDFKLLSVEAATHHRMTNLNTEVKPFLDLEDPQLIQFSHGAKFDDRFLYTAIGETVTALDRSGEPSEDYRFAGLISLDFATFNGLASLGATLKPAYDGIWTGVHPMGLASGVFQYEEMCFVFGKDDNGFNHLYRLMDTLGNDKGNIPIECKFYTRTLSFMAYDKEYPRPVPQMHKTLLDASLWLVHLENAIAFALSAAPDNFVDFQELSTIRVNADMSDGGQPQVRAKLPFPAFTKGACDRVSRRNINTGFEFQFLVEWAGVAQISKFMIAAEANTEVEKFECGLEDIRFTETGPDNFSYDIEA